MRQFHAISVQSSPDLQLATVDKRSTWSGHRGSGDLVLRRFFVSWQSGDAPLDAELLVPLSGKTDMPTLETARRNLLEELFAAFNRHDGSGVMACMTEDIIFDAATGPDISGRRLTGTSEVRTAFESTWTGMPDVSWQCTRARSLRRPRHFRMDISRDDQGGTAHRSGRM
jgi:hypothetical protein